MVRVALRVVQIVCELGTIQARRALGVTRVEVRARKIREAFVRLGPAFVKVGQALSTRRDALPVELCEELARLQDEMPSSLSGEQAVRVIERDLGASCSHLFEGLDADSTPVAAASLGQVYKAVDKATRRTVAVKVQRDDVADVVALDAVALRFVARAAGWLLGARTDVASVVDEVVGRIADELDYAREAVHAEKFARLYGDVAVVPGVVWPLCGSKVLTLTWVEGVKLQAWSQGRSEKEKQSVVEAGVKCTVKQFFETGFFHADPHPGNLLVRPDGRLCYLDFGKMGELTKDDRLALTTLLVHFVNRDAAGLAADFVDLGCILVRGREVKPGDRPPDSLVRALTATLAQRPRSTESTARLSFQGVLHEVQTALPGGRSSALSFRLPARFASIVRALGALEGAVLAVDPAFRVVAAAYPHVARALVLDTSPQGRAALRQLLVDDDGKLRWRRLRALFGVAPDRRTTSTTETSDLAHIVDALGGPRVAAAMLTDAIHFLASPRGLRTRASLLYDIDDMLADVVAQRLKNRDDSDVQQFVGVLDQLARLVVEAPDVWVPFLGNLATEPSTARAVATVLARVHARDRWRFPVLVVESSLAWLFNGTTKVR